MICIGTSLVAALLALERGLRPFPIVRFAAAMVFFILWYLGT
jgi:hypothetical protein